MDKKLLFIDIETVGETTDYDKYSKKKIWAERYCKENITTEEKSYLEKSALHPEFGKIVCISCGMKTSKGEIKTVSFIDTNEKNILDKFNELLDKSPDSELAGHNIKTFDLPFIFRRSIINGLKPHAKVSFYGLKPWEIQVTDTIELWKNGGFLSTGLDLIATSLGLPSPKDKISGQDVSKLFWSEGEKSFDKIKEYCEGDVKTTMMIYDRIMDPSLVSHTGSAPIPSERPRCNDAEYDDIATNTDYILGFEVEDLFILDVEKTYRISDSMKIKLGKLRWEKRDRKQAEDDLPF